MSLVKKVQNTIFQHKLFENNSGILLAVSGGPDSAAMLEIFSRLKKKYDLRLAVAHVNYGLRGKDSDRDEELVRELANKHELEIFVLKPKVQPLARQRLNLRQNLSEKYLRDIRYDFFEKIRRENNLDHITVAHNMDDQVETFLMRIIRGAGLLGLSSMKYKNEKIIRPLLNIPRKEILEYLQKNKLEFRIDRSNLQSKYLRNKIRNKLIPYLENNFNPQIRKTIFSSVENIALDYSYINQETDKVPTDKNILSVKNINNLHPAIRKRVLIKAISRIKGQKDIESAHIDEILKITSSKKNKRQVFEFKGLRLTRIGDKLLLQALNNNNAKVKSQKSK